MSDITEELEHSERGPSTAHRWRPCPASVRLSRGIPNEAGIEAALGTVFHEFAALCLEMGLEPHGFVGAEMEVKPHGVLTFDQKMADNMLAGLDVVRAYAAQPGAVMLVEKRVSLEEWVGPKEFGTTDCAIIDVQNWRLVVFDWKYGAGVPVSPVRNDQAILYTLGTWSTHAREMFYDALYDRAGGGGMWEDAPWEDDIEVIVIIEQPRAEGGGGVWKTTMGDILAEGLRIRQDAAATEDPDSPAVPGEKQCQFCPAGKHLRCVEKPKMLLKLLGSDFDDLESDFTMGVEPFIAPVLSPEQRSQLLLHRALFEKLFEDLHAAAFKDAELGRPVPGMKLVAGRSPPRAWRDEAKVEPVLKKHFGEAAYKKALLSPTAVEDLVGKKDFAVAFKRHVGEGQRKSILVPESDKREALRGYLSDFDDVSNDETAIV